jgi:hypothetical protein
VVMGEVLKRGTLIDSFYFRVLGRTRIYLSLVLSRMGLEKRG